MPGDRIWMADFVLCLNKGVLDAPFVLHVAHPNYVGKVLLFDDARSWQLFVGSYEGLGFCQVGHYRIAVAFWGTLQGNRVFPHPELERELKQLMERMAEFYLWHTIKPKEKFYEKKYRL